MSGARHPGRLPPEIINDICQALSRNEAVRERLPGWGRVHIDRQLPFLAIYRRPQKRTDHGTERLLLGEASYLLADAGEIGLGELKRLVGEIARTQAEAFGSILLLEIWTGPGGEDDPTFRIHAPDHGPPSYLLEVMETTLLEVLVEGQETKVHLRYGQKWAPPGMERLFDEEELARLGVVLMGLEVKPVFRDADSGELFPFELRALHHGLARALKKVFFLFSHDYTSNRPVHYFELGRRAMTAAVMETDRQLAEIDSRFDILLHVTPVNAEAAWAEFKGRSFEREPEFLYRPRNVDPALLKRQLYGIGLEEIEDPTLAHIFAVKREELARQLTMVEDRGSRRFLRGSQQVYGELEEGLLQLARQMLSRLPPGDSDDDPHPLSAADFVRRAEQELAHYRRQDPELAARVELRDDIPGLMVSRGNFLVGAGTKIAQPRVEAALAHEVGTHVLTNHNGRTQPFAQLHAGMAGYEALQEGLAVLSEYLVGGLSRPRLRLLAGRVVAVHAVTEGAGFVETYRELHGGHGFSREGAFMTAMRVHRGGGFTKDMVYLQGLVKLLDYLGRGGELELLYLGKVSLDHLPFIEELRWRQVLSPGTLRPRYLDHPAAGPRLERLRGGLSALELLEAIGS